MSILLINAMSTIIAELFKILNVIIVENLSTLWLLVMPYWYEWWPL